MSTKQRPEPPNQMTVVIHDISPLIHTNQPCSLRTVVIELTEEQRRKLQLNYAEEGYSSCILETK